MGSRWRPPQRFGRPPESNWIQDLHLTMVLWGDFAWLAKLFKETQPEVVALGIQELHPKLLPKFLQDVQQAPPSIATASSLAVLSFIHCHSQTLHRQRDFSKWMGIFFVDKGILHSFCCAKMVGRAGCRLSIWRSVALSARFGKTTAKNSRLQDMINDQPWRIVQTDLLRHLKEET